MVSLYAPNGRMVGSIFYDAKLVWFDRLARWLAESDQPASAAGAGRRLERRAHRRATSGIRAPVTAARTCRRPSARPSRGSGPWGLEDAYRRHHPEPGRYTWWDYRAGASTRTTACASTICFVTAPLAARTVAAEIDREARKGKPIPSDHAPLVIDVDAPGHPFDAGWSLGRGAASPARERGRRRHEPSRSRRPSSPCWRSSRTSCRRATGGSSSRSGTASARSCSRTATTCTSRAATCKPLNRYFPELRGARCARRCPRAAWWTARS